MWIPPPRPFTLMTVTKYWFILEIYCISAVHHLVKLENELEN